MSDTNDPFEGCDIDDPSGLMDRIAVAPQEPVYERPKRGRPPGGWNAQIDWELAEKLFVHGIIDGIDSEGNPIRRVPSYGEIATRVGTSKSNINLHAIRKKWREQRERRLADNTIEPLPASVMIRKVPEPAKAPEPAPVKPLEPENPRARSIEEAVEAIDEYIAYFRSRIASHDVRADSIADFDKAVRLRAFLKGEADRRGEVKHVITLEQMQSKHAAARSFAVRQVDDAVAGVLSAGDSGATDADDDGAPKVIDAELVDESSDDDDGKAA